MLNNIRIASGMDRPKFRHVAEVPKFRPRPKLVSVEGFLCAVLCSGEEPFSFLVSLLVLTSPSPCFRHKMGNDSSCELDSLKGVISNPTSEKRIAAVFQKFDEDGSGKIDKVCLLISTKRK